MYRVVITYEDGTQLRDLRTKSATVPMIKGCNPEYLRRYCFMTADEIRDNANRRADEYFGVSVRFERIDGRTKEAKRLPYFHIGDLVLSYRRNRYAAKIAD